MKPIKRVAHVVSSLSVGGAERLVVDLSHAQLRDGLRVTILDMGRDERPLGEEARRHGIAVIRVGRRRTRIGRFAALARHLVARPSQAVHVHNPGALRAVLPILPFVGGPVLYTRHGASPYAAENWRALHRVARSFVDRITFVTEEARLAFRSAHGNDWPDAVIRNGVPVAHAPPIRTIGNRLRLGAVGRLVELKQQKLILDAVAALPPDVGRRVEVHLFGDGPERDDLAQRASAAALAGVPVVFHGTVLDRESIYAHVDVLVVSSRTEGLSMAMLEAMARAVPVIATDVGGNRELVHDNRTGLLVPVNDVDALRDAIARTICEPTLTAKLGRASHELIAKRYSIDDIAARYQELYEEP
jgi:glycosyltransferase involved in cell wall biosynthesis